MRLTEVQPQSDELVELRQVDLLECSISASAGCCGRELLGDIYVLLGDIYVLRFVDCDGTGGDVAEPVQIDRLPSCLLCEFSDFAVYGVGGQHAAAI